MAIITPSDFIGQNNIPDKDLIGANLVGFIDKYESLFLVELLGSDLYDAYVATPEGERFVNLLPYIKPALTDYVYWYYLEDQAIQTLGTGAGVPNKQNSVTVSPYPKMIRAWNEMVKLNLRTRRFLTDNETIYPEFTPLMNYLPEWVWQLPFIHCHQNRYDIFTVRNSLGV